MENDFNLTKEMENICATCGKPINLDDFSLNREIPKYMKAHHVCFKCAFWNLRLKHDQEDLPNEGKIALITPDYSHWIVKKHGEILTVGTTFQGLTQTRLNPTYTILVKDEPIRIIMTNNIIAHQGTIPEHLRGLFEVNAVFLNPEEYKRLQDMKILTREYMENIIKNYSL